MSQTEHAQRAAEIARSPDPVVPCASSARHGDVCIRRVGEPIDGPHGPTPTGGVCLSAGAHGEHRLISDAYRDGGPGYVSLAAPGRLVHTDVPGGRHGTIELAPGKWQVGQSRELDAANVVVQVRD